MKGYFKSQKCAVCGAAVIVRSLGRSIPAKLAKAYAMADHVLTLHKLPAHAAAQRRGPAPGRKPKAARAAVWRVEWSSPRQAWMIVGPDGAQGFFESKAAAAAELERMAHRTNCLDCGGRGMFHRPGCPRSAGGRGAPGRHEQDEDCDVDPDTLSCRGCGVDHGGECPDCLGRGFHRPGCPGYRGQEPRGNNPRARFPVNPRAGKEWGVFQWSGEDRYPRAKAVKVYRVEGAAQKWTDRLNASMEFATAGRAGSGYVVRRLPCETCGLYDSHGIDCPAGRLRNRAGAKKRKAFRRSVMGKMGAYGRETKLMQRRGESLEAFRAGVAEGQAGACPLNPCRSKFTGQFERCAHSLGLKDAGVRVRAPKEAPAPWETLLPALAAKRNPPGGCRAGCRCKRCSNPPRRSKEWRPAPTSPAARAAAQLEARLMREGRKIYPRVVAVAARKGWEKVTREHDFTDGPKLPIYGTANGSLLIPRGQYALWGSA
jgi:hypothetical protein